MLFDPTLKIEVERLQECRNQHQDGHFRNGPVVCKVADIGENQVGNEFEEQQKVYDRQEFHHPRVYFYFSKEQDKKEKDGDEYGNANQLKGSQSIVIGPFFLKNYFLLSETLIKGKVLARLQFFLIEDAILERNSSFQVLQGAIRITDS